MIIIPEIETVMILVPRTGSGSLRRAIAKRYPKSMLIYRHMEADGLPLGYDQWKKVGVLREPVARLWSLYKFLRNFGGDHDPAYVQAMRESVSMGFSEWLVSNRVPFTTPYDSAGFGRFWPQYTVRHPLPENRKSQFMYLRPDLGTKVVPFNKLGDLAAWLDLDLDRENRTDDSGAPDLSPLAVEHVERWFRWDSIQYFSLQLPFGDLVEPHA